MPVHLGSMGDSVRAIRDAPRLHDGRGMKPGDVYMLNAPYNGGTHLPDVTVVMPVFDAARALPSTSPRAGTRATLAGSRRARCRPTAARSRRRGC
jgi:5-oxoprolinase (ATP-hydrolysing)